MKEIPKYKGEWCDSSCSHQRECYHDEDFDEMHGIRRLHVDFSLKHE